MLNALLLIAAILSALGFIWSIMIIRQQQHRERSINHSETGVKLTFLSNPMIWAYLLFPIVIVLGAALWISYYG